MTHQSSTTTVAILGTDTLADNILVRLLEREGYATRLLEPAPTGRVHELLGDADVVLLTPSLCPDVRGVFLKAIKNNPKSAHIPILSVSPTLKLTLLDELAADVSWRSLFDELVDEIETSLRGGAGAGETKAV